MMDTQSVLGYVELQSSKNTKIAHKVALVTPRMDVDVTGVSLKNMRTHLIDHPRDEGLKQREQLWNFQQKYRGAIGKLRNAPSTSGDDQKTETSYTEETPEESRSEQVRSANYDQMSLHSRFRKRLSRRIRLASMRPGEYYLDSLRGKSSRDNKEDERRNPGIQRLYSSGLIVKNTLYNQIRNGDSDVERRNQQPLDDSRILEAIERYGSLEKLPDIPYTGMSSQKPIRIFKTLNNYGRRIGEHLSDRRYLPLRRSCTNMSDVTGSSRRKLLIVSRREKDEHERMLRLGCIDSDNDDEDDDDNDADDEDDECDNENNVSQAEKLHSRDCEQKRPEHVDIRSNITQVNTEDDLVLIKKHHNVELKCKSKGYTTERSFYVEKRNERPNSIKKNVRCNSTGSMHTNPEDRITDSKRIKESDKSSNKKTEKDSKSSKKSRPVKDKKDKCEEKDESPESDESLDIPGHRVGHTTHSIDRKLAIRKPWEWRPSPFRWTDKAYVRESDKPYIERIINKGEIIDEFNYDSFARTKPLKLQNYPENAGYKDRNGVIR